jgi:hypothetical protein
MMVSQRLVLSRSTVAEAAQIVDSVVAVLFIVIESSCAVHARARQHTDTVHGLLTVARYHIAMETISHAL